jgi:hypothetical protein
MEDRPHIFSVVPIELASDPRLTNRHRRVLIALFSFRSKNTDTVWPKRATLSARCGLRLSDISVATTELVGLGWLAKVGSGGHGRPVQYQITVPEVSTVLECGTVPAFSTVPKPGTVPDSGIRTVPGSSTTTVPESSTHNEQSMEVSKEQSIPCPASQPDGHGNESKTIPNCPHDQIIDIFHAELPELPKVLKSRWSGSKSETALRARWKEDERHRSMEFWQRFFRCVKTNPHWMGRNDREWKADLHWLLIRSNFDKVLQKLVDNQQRRWVVA